MKSLLLAVLLVPTSGRSLVSARATDLKVAAGTSEVDAKVEVTVAEGFHVQANPASEDYLIPTKLELVGAKVAKLTYPPGKSFRLQGTDKSFAVYDGTFPIVARLSLAGMKPGHYEVKGQVEYQACDMRSCRPPTSAPVTLAIDITGK